MIFTTVMIGENKRNIYQMSINWSRFESKLNFEIFLISRVIRNMIELHFNSATI